jgi:RNA polymerase-binding transcription factor DksA
MSDDVDKTQERLELEETIRKRYRKQEATPIKGMGYCLNCGEPIRKDWRWCDQDCRDDYEHRTNK